MGASATPVGGLPPLPPGASLMPSTPPASGLPQLPPGASLIDSTNQPTNQSTNQSNNATAPTSAASKPEPNLLSRIGSFLGDVNDYAVQPVNDVTKGIAKGAIKTGAGVLDLAAKANHAIDSTLGLPGADEHLAATKQATDWLREHAEDHGIWQQLGDYGENAAELLIPGLGEAGAAADTAKAATFGEKAAEVAKTANFLEKTPMGQRLAKLAALGARTLKAAATSGAEVGGQTYVKTGGDADAAARAAQTGGLVGAGGAAILTPAGELLSDAIANRATTLEDVGGVPTAIPAEARNAKPTPEQAAGQQALRNAAQNTAKARLEEVNESRAVPEDAPGLPARTGPYTFELRGIPPRETTTGDIAQPAAKRSQAAFKPLQYTTSSTYFPAWQGYEGTSGTDVATGRTPKLRRDVATGGGVLHTQDPNIVKAHIANLNDLIDSPDFAQMPAEQQAQIRAARFDAQKQMGQYHESVRQNLPGNAGKPNFPQLDIPTEVKNIGSYSDVAQKLNDLAVDGYNSISDALGLNDISGGKFNALRNANKEAWAKYTGATSPDARKAAESEVDATNRAMDDLLRNDIGGAVSPKELAGFNEAYGQAQKLKYIGNVFDKAYSGNPGRSARSFEYRGFNGQTLMNGLNGLERKFGRATLSRLMGEENLNTAYQVAELNRTQAQRAKFGVAMKPVADWVTLHSVGAGGVGAAAAHFVGVPWEAGYLGAAAADQAMRRTMNAVLTNPKVAQNLIYAIESGARPAIYGPYIGALIQRSETERSRQEQANGGTK